MQTLSVMGVERGAVVVISPDGERFRLPVDASLMARLQAAVGPSDEKRMSPREIQAHVRAGMTTEQVAALAGVSVAAIERFVGPVLAERSYVVESALAVRLPPETEGARSRTFGAVMGDRLAALAATQIRWSSAKEPSGWVLAASFVADDVQHDARWRFDAKRMQLDPDNVEASTLSQRGTPAALTPRLRAIEPTAPVTIIPLADATPAPAKTVAPQSDVTRFDSAIFRFPDLTREVGDRRPAARSDEPAARSSGPTTDQLASLSRRRGQREPVDTGSLPITTAIEVIDDADEVGDVFAPRPVPERARSAAVTQGRFGSRTAPAQEPDASEALAPAQEERSNAFRPRIVPQGTAASTGQQAVQGRRSQATGPQPSTPAPRPTEAQEPAAVQPATTPARPAPSRRSETRPQAPSRADAPRPEQPAARRQAPATPNETGELRRPRARRSERRDEDQSVTETLPPLSDTSAQTRGGQSVRPRRGRTSMPSWDEIVFGRDEH